MNSSRASRLKNMFERFTPNTKTETVSIEEHNKVKQALTEANTKVIELTKVNEHVTEENTTLLQRLNKLESDYRHDVIAALFEGINLSPEDKLNSINSFTQSNLSFEFIADHCSQLREQLGGGRTKSVLTGSTKLPQRSTTQEEEAEQEENKRMRERRNHSYID